MKGAMGRAMGCPETASAMAYRPVGCERPAERQAARLGTATLAALVHEVLVRSPSGLKPVR